MKAKHIHEYKLIGEKEILDMAERYVGFKSTTFESNEWNMELKFIGNTVAGEPCLVVQFIAKE